MLQQGVRKRVVFILVVLTSALTFMFAPSAPLVATDRANDGAVWWTRSVDGDLRNDITKLQRQMQEMVSSKPLNHARPYAIPEGAAVAMPSVRVAKEDYDGPKREKGNQVTYGGDGDKAHLGGFTAFDAMGVSPIVWSDMVRYFGIRSILDVGCGRGTSTSWFMLHGLDTYCVEGSHDAVEKTMLPDTSRITEHDFSRGPWWPEKTVDAIWSVEFLEHVGRNYHQNYIPAFRKAAFIFVTSSRWGGWHHVEVHDDRWWIAKMQTYGFVYSEDLTQRVRTMAGKQARAKSPLFEKAENWAQHIRLSMKVFINPAVASLPEHQHLFADDGCFSHHLKPGLVIVNKPCDAKKGESEILPEYKPLELTAEMDTAWEKLVLENINKYT